MRQNYLPDNSPDQIKQRRAQDTLIIVGSGVILFGIWTVLKSIGMLFITREELMEQIREAIDAQHLPVNERLVMVIALVMIGLFLLAGILIRVIIGTSAIAAGRNRKHGAAYIPLTILMILTSMLSIGGGLGSFFISVKEETAGDSSLSGIIIEITSIIMLIEMLVSAARLRKYRKKAEKLEQL